MFGVVLLIDRYSVNEVHSILLLTKREQRDVLEGSLIGKCEKFATTTLQVNEPEVSLQEAVMPSITITWSGNEVQDSISPEVNDLGTYSFKLISELADK